MIHGAYLLTLIRLNFTTVVEAVTIQTTLLERLRYSCSSSPYHAHRPHLHLRYVFACLISMHF
jgi:hypothetical protein